MNLDHSAINYRTEGRQWLTLTIPLCGESDDPRIKRLNELTNGGGFRTAMFLPFDGDSRLLTAVLEPNSPRIVVTSR